VAAPEAPLPSATAGERELFSQLVFGAVFAVVGGVAGVGAGTKICLDDVGDYGCLLSQCQQAGDRIGGPAANRIAFVHR
jgi:hypothetical protein